MTIDKNDPIPLYYQIKGEIFKDIEDKRLTPGERLPAERKLAKKYDVTRVTIRNAIKILVEQGYLEVRPGSGTYVLDRYPKQNNGGNKIIGVLVRDIQRGIMIDLIRGIEDQAISAGYNTIICNTENKWEKANTYVNQLISNGVKGVIYIPIQDIENIEKKEEENEKIIRQFFDYNIPVVLVDHDCKRIETDLVVGDNFGGGYELTNHLLDMGHRRIAVIYDFLETSIEDRIDGYKNALRNHKIEYDPILVQHIKEYGFTESFENRIKLIIDDLKATAIFAMNDLLAADIYYHVRNLNLNIPNDISVVGYDDLPFADRMRTPLTTIHQPIYQMAVESTKLIFERMKNPPNHVKKIILQNRLVIRKSVKKLKI